MGAIGDVGNDIANHSRKLLRPWDRFVDTSI